MGCNFNQYHLIELITHLSLITKIDSFLLDNQLNAISQTNNNKRLVNHYCLSCEAFFKVQNNDAPVSLNCANGYQFLASYITIGDIPAATVIVGPFTTLNNNTSCHRSETIPVVSHHSYSAIQTTVDSYAALISQKQLITLTNDSFSKVSDYIKTHIGEDLSVDTIKTALLIPRNTIFQTVKDATSMSLGHYIKKVRLEHASLLLTSSDFSVSQISEMCGIFDCNYFSRIFKKQHGLTPREYRKKNS
jgi:AraC-like DNA-binding protein